MTQIVGYRLIEDATGVEVASWGGVWGRCPGVPNPVTLPNGDQVCGLPPGGSSGGYTLAAWEMEPPPPTAADVRGEAQRRIIAATGATDMTSCLTKQLNAQMRAAELINKKADGGTLTEAEAAEAAALQAFADTIKAIRASSNAMEADPPSDYADDARWP